MAFTVENPFARANKPRTIRFTEELFDELEEAAKENNISFNMLVLQCCRYALDNLPQELEEDSSTKSDAIP